MRTDLRGILITGLVVGLLDIVAACTMAVARGSTPLRLLQFVASGLLGRSAFQGGVSTAALGLVLHFAIAFAVVVVFSVALQKIAVVRKRVAAAGIVYGLVVWLVMNFLVLPLSAARPRHALVPDLIQIAIHMFIIGLPTALLLRRFSGVSAR